MDDLMSVVALVSWGGETDLMKDNLFSHDSIRAAGRIATSGDIVFVTTGVFTLALIVISLNTDLSSFPWAFLIVGCLCSLGYGLAAGVRGETEFDWRGFVSLGGTTFACIGGFALLFALYFSR
jgi:hypothetical protein